MEVFNSVLIKSIWSSRDIGWEFVESLGASGGILTMWDSSLISVIEMIKGRFSLSINVSPKVIRSSGLLMFTDPASIVKEN